MPDKHRRRETTAGLPARIPVCHVGSVQTVQRKTRIERLEGRPYVGVIVRPSVPPDASIVWVESRALTDEPRAAVVIGDKPENTNVEEIRQ